MPGLDPNSTHPLQRKLRNTVSCQSYGSGFESIFSSNGEILVIHLLLYSHIRIIPSRKNRSKSDLFKKSGPTKIRKNPYPYLQIWAVLDV